MDEEMNPIPMEVTAAYTGLGLILVIVVSVILAGLYCLACKRCCDEN